jgi:hypothetical protein
LENGVEVYYIAVGRGGSRYDSNCFRSATILYCFVSLLFDFEVRRAAELQEKWEIPGVQG